MKGIKYLLVVPMLTCAVGALQQAKVAAVKDSSAVSTVAVEKVTETTGAKVTEAKETKATETADAKATDAKETKATETTDAKAAAAQFLAQLESVRKDIKVHEKQLNLFIDELQDELKAAENLGVDYPEVNFNEVQALVEKYTNVEKQLSSAYDSYNKEAKVVEAELKQGILSYNFSALLMKYDELKKQFDSVEKETEATLAEVKIHINLHKKIKELDKETKDGAKKAISDLLDGNVFAQDPCNDLFTNANWGDLTLQDVAQYFVVCYNEGLWGLKNDKGQIAKLRETFKLDETDKPTKNITDLMKWIRSNIGFDKPLSQLDANAASFKSNAQKYILDVIGDNAFAQDPCNDLFTNSKWSHLTLQDVAQYFVVCYNEGLWGLKNDKDQVAKLRETFKLDKTVKPTKNITGLMDWIRSNIGFNKTLSHLDANAASFKSNARKYILSVIGDNAFAQDPCGDLFTNSKWGNLTLQDVAQYFVVCYNEGLWGLKNDKGQIAKLRSTFNLPATNEPSARISDLMKWIRSNIGFNKTLRQLDANAASFKLNAQKYILSIIGKNIFAQDPCNDLFTNNRWSHLTLQDVAQYFVVCYHEGLWGLKNDKDQIAKLRATFNLPAKNEPSPRISDLMNWIRSNIGFNKTLSQLDANAASFKSNAQKYISGLIGDHFAQDPCKDLFTNSRWADLTLQDVAQYFVVCYNEGLWGLKNDRGQIAALRRTFNLIETVQPTDNIAKLIDWVRENYRAVLNKNKDRDSDLVTCVKLSPFKNDPGRKGRSITRITPHCMAGWMTAAGCGDWFQNPKAKCSSNYGIGYNGEIGQYVRECDRAWTSSSHDNDSRAVTIECSSSKDGKQVTDATWNSLIKLCTDICKRHGKKKLTWIPDKDRALAYEPKSDEMLLTIHRWFANTDCPGEFLLSRMGDLASAVTKNLE